MQKRRRQAAGAFALFVLLLVRCAHGDADYPAGLVRTVAGSSQTGYLDGTGTNARFAGLLSFALTPDGRTAVVVDTSNRIRRVEVEGGEVSTLAGTANDACAVIDGVGVEAQFCRPRHVEISSDGSTAWVWQAMSTGSWNPLLSHYSASLPRSISLSNGQVPASPPSSHRRCESTSLEECNAYAAAQTVPWQVMPVRENETESCASNVNLGCSLEGERADTSIVFNTCADKTQKPTPFFESKDAAPGGPWIKGYCGVIGVEPALSARAWQLAERWRGTGFIGKVSEGNVSLQKADCLNKCLGTPRATACEFTESYGCYAHWRPVADRTYSSNSPSGLWSDFWCWIIPQPYQAARVCAGGQLSMPWEPQWPNSLYLNGRISFTEPQ